MALMVWDGIIHWSPKRMEILEVYMTLGQVKVWARTDLALVSKTITVTCILDCVWPVCLKTSRSIAIPSDIETSPTKDKHAHGVAERSVGNIVTKANIAMMGNINNPCPQTYWPDAIQYACHCDGFGYKSKIGTSPYFYLTQRHVHLKYLHPFWTPVYYTIPHHERHGGKLGQARALKGYFVGYSYSKYLQPCYRVVAQYAN